MESRSDYLCAPVGLPSVWVSATVNSREKQSRYPDSKHRGANQSELFMHIRKGIYTFSSDHGWDSISDEAKDFVSKLLVVKPHKRYNYDQIVEHEWIKSSKTDKIDLTSRLKNLEEFSRKRRQVEAKLTAQKAAFLFAEMGGMLGFDDDEEEQEQDEEEEKLGDGED